MDYKKTMVAIILVIIIISLSTTYLYVQDSKRTKLVIFHAGSLILPLERMKTEFKKMHPDVDVILEASGSIDAARKITDLNRSADLLIVADYNVIVNYLFPKNLSNWYIIFARNEIVIAYTNKSMYSNEINQDNWFYILNRSDVSFGHSDPNRDPCGYRTLLVWKLADNYYGVNIYESLNAKTDKRIIRPKSVELLALLESGELDYAFEYKSVAVQHNLSYVELPSEINLGNQNMSDIYATVNVTLDDGTIFFGEPILYGLTIPKTAKEYELAVEFLRLLFSDIGMKILYELGQPPVNPGITNDIHKVPLAIRDTVTQMTP